jgi:hypothetical protein
MKDFDKIILRYMADSADIKNRIEQNIIGAILLENGIMNRVADLLTYKNFSGHHRMLYQTMHEMHGKMPIDMITVYNHVKVKTITDFKTDAKTWALTLSACLSRVNDSANIETHALLLIEYSIVDQVLQAYSQTDKSAVAEAMGTEIIVDLFASTDRLQSMHAASAWLNASIPDEPLTEAINDIISNVSKKAHKVLQREKMRTLLQQVQLIYGTPQNRQLISTLSSTLIRVLNEGPPSDAFSDQVYSLQSHFMDHKRTAI